MSTELDLGALRKIADGVRNLSFELDDDECLRVWDVAGDGYLLDCKPREAKDAIVAMLNAFPALLAAAGERDALQAAVERRELHMHRMLSLVGRALEGQHVSKEFGGNAPEDVQGLLDQAFVLHQKTAALQAEVERLRAVERAAREVASYLHTSTLSMNRIKYSGATWYALAPEYVEGAREIHERLAAALAPAAAKEVR